MSEFAHDKIKPFSAEGGKKEQVSTMFDSIAPRYDFMNRLLSLGIDKGWRRKAISVLQQDAPKHILDVATGTADMALMTAKQLGPQKITGIDISEGMLQLGRQKVARAGLETHIELLEGDSETIKFADNSFDAVVVAFGVRNFENLEKGLQEMLRVMKPGAKLVVLEFSQPAIPGVREFYHFYMGSIAPQVAKWFRQNKKAYQYLNCSARAFPDRQNFIDVLKKVGYSDTSFKPLSLGICCIYVGRKL
ncbi:MAG: bifunctional demethylmenaquinone methyltransferase/2-methoxy-6-polyprenyl-1,4-benzoquinol methylase UbiE [Chitinophagaceae bacterium]